MNEIITYSSQSLTTTKGQDLSSGLFYDFVEWIDQSEKTTRTYLKNLRAFMAWLKYRAITRPERKDILSYRQWLTVEHDAICLDPESLEGWKYRTDKSGNPIKINCKPNTVAQYLRSVCQFFRWTAANNLYPNIAENVHAPKVQNKEEHRRQAFEVSEIQIIEKSIEKSATAKTEAAAAAAKDKAGRIQRSDEQGKRLYAIYQLITNAGLRTIEISRANVKDLEIKGGQAWFYIWGKGHSDADTRKPIAPEVAEAIKEYLQSRTDHPTGNSPLFVATGNRSGGKRLAATTISTMLKQAMKQAGFDSEKLTAHSLRHTTGTAVMDITGNDLYTAQHYLRHANPTTTERYLHNETQQKEAGIAQQLYDLFHGKEAIDNRAKLENILNRMNTSQLEQLTNIAAAMA